MNTPWLHARLPCLIASARAAWLRQAFWRIPALLAALAACASTPAPREAPEPAPSFIEDDYAAALDAARAAGKPLFVDAWAPWCHSCLALKTQVMVDPRLGVVGDDFVWLALDTERPSSAAFVARFPPPAMPTLYVIDPRSEAIVLRWVGTATTEQLVELLRDARAAYDGKGAVDATALLLEGDVRASAGDADGAMAAWRTALERSPSDWPKRARAANALTFALARAGRHRDCAELARDELGKVTRATAGASDLAIGGLGCALELEASAEREALVTPLRAAVREVASDDRLLADDRSGAFDTLVSAAETLGDEPARLATALEWATFLEGRAAAAKTPAERAAFDPHRMFAYLAAKKGELALDMLARSERDFPADYNPPARIAYTLLQLGRYDEALAASARAERLLYGPRTLRILAVKADILEKKGDKAAALAALDAALAAAEALPAAQRPAKTVKGLVDRRAKLAASIAP